MPAVGIDDSGPYDPNWTPPPTSGSTWIPGTSGDPGYTPDYMALLRADPQYQAWVASASARNIGFANQRAAIIRELIRQFGGVPQAWADAFGDIRPEDVAAAQGNQFGTQQVIQRNYDQNVNAMRRALAARGMLQTGELNYGQGQQDLARGQEEATAFSDFMGKVGEAVGAYTGNVAGVQGEEAGVVGSVMPALRELYPTTPATKGTPGHWQTTPMPKAPSNTFTWGGRTFSQRPAWEKYAGAHGINLKNWYRQHPVVAKQFGVR